MSLECEAQDSFFKGKVELATLQTNNTINLHIRQIINYSNIW